MTKVISTIKEISGGALVIGFFESTEFPTCAVEFDQALGGVLKKLFLEKEIKTKLGECFSMLTLGQLPVRRIIAVGLGAEEKYTRTQARLAAAQAARYATNCKESLLICHLASLCGQMSIDEASEVVTEGSWLGTYVFDKYLHEKKDRLQELKILIEQKDNLEIVNAGASEGDIIVRCVESVRNLVNESPQVLNPVSFTEMVRKVALDNCLCFEELNEKDLSARGMNALLTVGRGSVFPPRLLTLEYLGREGKKCDLVLVGKGITFDSGGLNIKSPGSMADMKDDMAGAASVLQALVAISQMGLLINVAAVIPLAENMPSGGAAKQGEVVQTYDGKTVEILNTDAEGRLILADAIAYAIDVLKPKRLVDVATLTGAAMRALGLNTIAVFTNNPQLLEEVDEAAKYAGDTIWQLPLSEEYTEMIKSEIADIKNTGGEYAGASTAAAFLKEFVGATPWVHMDIAGPVRAEKTKGHLVKGPSGVPTATLIALAANLSEDYD